jgi:hypothetical protein
MDVIDAAMVESMLAADTEPCVSIYLPTHRAGPGTRQDPIRLKNLLDDARAELVARGMRTGDADALLQPGTDLHDDDFWQHQEDGLAVFLAPGQSRVWRLPAPFEELVVVGDSFHIKPLLGVVSRGERFHVLALSENEVRLLWGSRYRVTQVDLPDRVSEGIAAALWFEDPERQLQYHLAERRGEGRLQAVFHGHGAGKDDDHERRDRFLRLVDGAVREIVSHETPLVLAGVGTITDAFRRVSDHPLILPGAVPGNPEHLSSEDLHARAWEVAAAHFDGERRDATVAWEERPDRRAAGVEETLRAALAGRVDTVFLPAGEYRWGTFDPETAATEEHDERIQGDRDLLDVAAVLTWTRGGKVFVVGEDEVPGERAVAALLRY